MKRRWVLGLAFCFLGNLALAAGPSAANASAAKNVKAHEDWKGPSQPEEFSFAAMAGAAILNGSVGFGLLGAFAMKVVDCGFIGGDISDQVYLETEAGPMFFKGTTPVAVGIHLRWDFHRDEDFSLFAIGGAQSLIATDTVPGMSKFQIYPRFGVGLVYEFAGNIGFRAELGHEFIGAGVSFKM